MLRKQQVRDRQVPAAGRPSSCPGGLQAADRADPARTGPPADRCALVRQRNPDRVIPQISLQSMLNIPTGFRRSDELH